jgi:hypothetical protein
MSREVSNEADELCMNTMILLCWRRPFAEKYAASQDDFFADYVPAHLKLSELGAKWEGGAPAAVAI